MAAKKRTPSLIKHQKICAGAKLVKWKCKCNVEKLYDDEGESIYDVCEVHNFHHQCVACKRLFR